MTRPDLAQELDAVTRHLVLLTALVENIASSVRRPQDDPDDEPAPHDGPDGTRGATGKGNPAARRRTRAPGDLPAAPKKRMDGTGMPACTCPPCLAERERGERP